MLILCWYLTVVPSAAEDFLLEFLDETFIATSPNQAWSNWLDLLRLITASRKEEACGDTEAEIFEANKSSNNITDFHVTYKCYMHVITAMEKAAAAQSDIQKIRLEFPFLCDLWNIWNNFFYNQKICELDFSTNLKYDI